MDSFSHRIATKVSAYPAGRNRQCGNQRHHLRGDKRSYPAVIGDYRTLRLSYILSRDLATATHKNYEVVEGICAGISTPMLRRYRKVHLIDSHGTEITLLLSKSARLKIGSPYRFYFQKGARPAVGNEYLDAALSTNNFLGYEENNGANKDTV